MDNCGHAGAVFVFECGSVGRPSKNNQSRINSSNMFHQLTHISTLEIFFGKWLIEGTKCFFRIFCFFVLKTDKKWYKLYSPVVIYRTVSLCLVVKIIQKRQQLQTSGEKKLSKELLLEKLQTKYFVRNYEQNVLPYIQHHRWYLFTGHREGYFKFSWDWNHFLQRQ